MNNKLPSEFYDLLAWLCQHASFSLFAKLDYITQNFLGRPYQAGALGEGPGAEFDCNPILRADKFDCVTYVNTVLALLHATNSVLLYFHLARIGYRNGRVRYENRHHFMSCDWNLANAESGYIQDITMSIVDNHNKSIYEMAHAYIDKQRWLDCQQKPIRMQGTHAYIPYLPLTDLFDVRGNENTAYFNQLPEVAIIEIVRPNWNLTQTIGTHLNVSHVGFLLRYDDAFVFRHASQVKQQVVDEPLIPYLQKFLNSPTIKGVNIHRILP